MGSWWGLLFCSLVLTECLTATCGLAAKVEPLEGDLLALAPRVVLQGWFLALAMELQGSGFKRVFMFFLFFFLLLFPVKSQIEETLQIFNKGSELMLRRIYSESPYFLVSLLRLK